MQSQSSQTTTPTGASESSSRPITELEINVMKLKSELSAMMISRDSLKQEVGMLVFVMLEIICSLYTRCL